MKRGTLTAVEGVSPMRGAFSQSTKGFYPSHMWVGSVNQSRPLSFYKNMSIFIGSSRLSPVSLFDVSLSSILIFLLTFMDNLLKQPTAARVSLQSYPFLTKVTIRILYNSFP